MGKKRRKKVSVGFISLGCAKNVVDSERMLAEIVQGGFVLAAEPSEADVVVINTCGFIKAAKDEAIGVIKEAVGWKKNGSVKKVIVAGCLAERAGEDLFDQVSGIDAIVGLGQRDNIAEIIGQTINETSSLVFTGDCSAGVNDDRARLLITPGHWAYLRISEGCDHKCSFCTIPAIRGRFRSKPEELVVEEAQELVDSGVVELNIIAQDTAYYGRDLKVKNGLADLLKKVEAIEGLEWVRLMYLYPAGITDKLIETIASSEKVVHYFDIPIQHINNEVLKGMARPDRKEKICALLEKLRNTFSDIILRTTVIVGFPGESNEQFEELIKFIKWAKFDALGCFAYSAEEGTAAAHMARQVPEQIKQQRVETLMLCQQEIAFAKNKCRLGSEIRCIVDSADEQGGGEGRHYGQAPQIDSICIIEKCSAKPGEFIETKVVGTKEYDLVVEQI